jgi:hypothetical protein
VPYVKAFHILLLLSTRGLVAEPSFRYPITIPLGDTVTTIAVADFNGDGLGDFAVSYGTSGLAVFLGRPEGSFIRKDVLLPSGFIVRDLIAVADINGDAKADLVGVGGYPYEPLNPLAQFGNFVSYGNGHGTFQEPVFLTLASGVNGTFIPLNYGIAVAALCVGSQSFATSCSLKTSSIL